MYRPEARRMSPFLPLAAAIEAHWGWRAAVFPTLGGLVVAGLGVALLMVDRPADLGLAPYGGKTIAPAISQDFIVRSHETGTSG